ncbi:hypothetical protein GCM10023170_011280 [Phytohabitans houttuyneae]|uniref:Uncharacterized protein n=1 Tax=Phytohabitans houttuyneae TaxID=1076126 RepID=A0A6V8K7M2_9ACTN|nr:hypothetical protein Phou_037000 [Phytohabitans houttuyneae]
MNDVDDELPPYADRCPKCRIRTVVPPLLVRRNQRGTGVTADYACPRGHTWYTNWAWWTGAPHSTDSEAA